MLHRTAAALLASLRTMLEACHEEATHGTITDANAWARVVDLIDADLFVAAAARLDEREEDRQLVQELSRLLAAVNRDVIARDKADTAANAKATGEAEPCPLFAGIE